MNYTISQERRGSLQRQLVWAINIALIFTLSTALSLDYFQQKKTLHQNFRALMLQGARHVELALHNSSSYRSAIESLQQFCAVMSGHSDPGHEISLISEEGKVLVSSKKNLNSVAEGEIIEESASTNQYELWSEIEKNNQIYTSLVLPFQHTWSDRPFHGAIRYVESQARIQSLLHQLVLNHTLTILAAMIVLSMLTKGILRTKVLKPLDRLFVQSYALSSGDYVTWEQKGPGNELNDIQSMFNYMVEKIKQHEESLVRKERKSAVIETSAQAYNSVVSRISKIIDHCDFIKRDDGGSQYAKNQILPEKIQQECQRIMQDLSHLTDLLDFNTPKDGNGEVGSIIEQSNEVVMATKME